MESEDTAHRSSCYTVGSYCLFYIYTHMYKICLYDLNHFAVPLKLIHAVSQLKKKTKNTAVRVVFRASGSCVFCTRSQLDTNNWCDVGHPRQLPFFSTSFPLALWAKDSDPGEEGEALRGWGTTPPTSALDKLISASSTFPELVLWIE